MSDTKQRPYDNDDDGYDGHDDDHGHNIHDDRELVHYVHDMLRSLEAITASRALNDLSRRIGDAKDAAHALLWAG